MAVLAIVAMLLVSLLQPVPAAAASGPSVVVAVADTGVNPYHEIFYRPNNTAHPCSYVAGFDDCSIPALNLSIGVYDDWAQAVEADRAVWESAEPHQWYWIPKTNIIGAVCDPAGSISVTATLCILDESGHGTSTASSVLTEAPDALLVIHEGDTAARDMATAPVVADIQSHSWGPAAPVPLQAVDMVVPGPSERCEMGAFDEETLFFIGAGNEAPFPAILDCARVDNRVQVIGGGTPGTWDAQSWTMYDFASWFCRPTADFESVTAMRSQSCGTSFSSPTAAGAAAAALQQVRNAEGYTGRSTPTMVSTTVSRDAFIAAMRAAASYTPESKFTNKSITGVPLPEQAPHLFWGYGWLDSTVSGAVASCALGGTCPTKSPESEEYNAWRRSTRHTMTSDVMPSDPPDDGGSGRDAGDTRRTAVHITPGSYSGRVNAYVLGDVTDTYVFDAEQGQAINMRVAGTHIDRFFGCWQIRNPADVVIDSGCDDAGDVTTSRPGLTAAEAGEYVFAYIYSVPAHDYRFSLGLDAPAPGVS